MQDVQILYTVTGVVVAALGAWVGKVLATAPVATTPGHGPPPSSARTRDVRDAVREDEQKLASLPKLGMDEDEEPTGPHALILVTAVGHTDRGRTRKSNEDSFLIDEEHHLLAIADGMGRHAAGEVASSLAVEAIRDAFANDVASKTPGEPTLAKRANRLRNAVCLANERIHARAGEVPEYAGMGTTVVAAHFSPNKQQVYIAHVGDSRCYRLRAGKLVRLTQDHTLGAAGIGGKNANVLVRALGTEPTVEVDLAQEAPMPGDVYLLCSDGLTPHGLGRQDPRDPRFGEGARGGDDEAHRAGEPGRREGQHHRRPRRHLRRARAPVSLRSRSSRRGGRRGGRSRGTRPGPPSRS